MAAGAHTSAQEAKNLPPEEPPPPRLALRLPLLMWERAVNAKTHEILLAVVCIPVALAAGSLAKNWVEGKSSRPHAAEMDITPVPPASLNRAAGEVVTWKTNCMSGGGVVEDVVPDSMMRCHMRSPAGQLVFVDAYIQRVERLNK